MAERARTFEICADTANARANDSTSVMLRYGTDSLSLLSAVRRRYFLPEVVCAFGGSFCVALFHCASRRTPKKTESADVAVRKRNIDRGSRRLLSDPCRQPSSAGY